MRLYLVIGRPPGNPENRFVAGTGDLARRPEGDLCRRARGSAGECRLHLGEDGQGDLLRALGADVHPHRGVQAGPVAGGGAQLVEQALRAGARPEQPRVAQGRA
jgi:hypothetical protein